MASKALTNRDLFKKISGIDPNFKNSTAKLTHDMFTERGFEALAKGGNRKVLDDMFHLSMTFFLQSVDVSKAVDTLEAQGFGAKYATAYGAFIQRIAITGVKPISPAFSKLENNTTLDPFVIRKAEAEERFFELNFDYQSLLTIPDEVQFKRIFMDDFGLALYHSKLVEALEQGYVIQKYVNKLDCLNATINSTRYPLQESQIIKMPMDLTNEDNLKDFTEVLNNVVSLLKVKPQTGDYNALGFVNRVNTDNLKLLVRGNLPNALKRRVLATTYNPDKLNIPVDIVEVEHFGGLQLYKDAAFSTTIYPVYSKLGEVVGYSENQNTDTPTISLKDKIYTRDPNENVFAILADKELIFESNRSGYTVEPIRNPRGLYTNFWASSVNNTIASDPISTLIIFKES